MLISRREAAARLGPAAKLSRRRAEVVLDSGLAGAPVRTRAATLFEEEAVERLLARRWLDPAAEESVFPYGALVSRRAFDVRHDDPLTVLADGWDMSVWTWVWIRHLVGEHGFVPMVATICGFVVAGAEVLGVGGSGRRTARLRLRPAGAWWAQVDETWFPTGPGHVWSLRLPAPEGRPERGRLWP